MSSIPLPLSIIQNPKISPDLYALVHEHGGIPLPADKPVYATTMTLLNDILADEHEDDATWDEAREFGEAFESAHAAASILAEHIASAQARTVPKYKPKLAPFVVGSPEFESEPAPTQPVRWEDEWRRPLDGWRVPSPPRRDDNGGSGYAGHSAPLVREQLGNSDVGCEIEDAEGECGTEENDLVLDHVLSAYNEGMYTRHFEYADKKGYVLDEGLIDERYDGDVAEGDLSDQATTAFSDTLKSGWGIGLPIKDGDDGGWGYIAPEPERIKRSRSKTANLNLAAQPSEHDASIQALSNRLTQLLEPVPEEPKADSAVYVELAEVKLKLAALEEAIESLKAAAAPKKSLAHIINAHPGETARQKNRMRQHLGLVLEAVPNAEGQMPWPELEPIRCVEDVGHLQHPEKWIAFYAGFCPPRLDRVEMEAAIFAAIGVDGFEIVREYVGGYQEAAEEDDEHDSEEEDSSDAEENESADEGHYEQYNDVELGDAAMVADEDVEELDGEWDQIDDEL